MDKITLSVQEVAELLGVSPVTIYYMVRDKQIPHVRIRRRVMFHRDAIEAWLRGETVDAVKPHA
ncbi:helix-turn-helix domain-containing protein [Alicyclobacillus shizuokensis]|uniref:helix-turn-helix domain-containing protein n=1 Tax=Alicyclobacillus shizuokensis TaxID=392014 RepID=UPI0008376332|nr:helix-turn-helix domain-containing protein [Alicyclobacillus shizuokensis]